jgi:hypothetical protein
MFSGGVTLQNECFENSIHRCANLTFTGKTSRYLPYYILIYIFNKPFYIFSQHNCVRMVSRL